MIPYGIAKYIITKSELEEFKIEIWNEAIEHAAVDLQKSYPDNVSTNAFCAAIRSLKK